MELNCDKLAIGLLKTLTCLHAEQLYGSVASGIGRPICANFEASPDHQIIETICDWSGASYAVEFWRTGIAF